MIIREGIGVWEEVAGIFVTVRKGVIIGGEAVIRTLSRKVKHIFHYLITVISDFDGKKF